MRKIVISYRAHGVERPALRFGDLHRARAVDNAPRCNRDKRKQAPSAAMTQSRRRKTGPAPPIIRILMRLEFPGARFKAHGGRLS